MTDVTEVQNGEHLAASTLLAAAAIVAAQADARGIHHWTDIADQLTRHAARQAALRATPTDSDDEDTP